MNTERPRSPAVSRPNPWIRAIRPAIVAGILAALPSIAGTLGLGEGGLRFMGVIWFANTAVLILFLSANRGFRRTWAPYYYHGAAVMSVVYVLVSLSTIELILYYR